MCGFAGVFYRDGELSKPSRAMLQDMASAIVHRGPDESAVYIENGVGLAHARLSIIDIASGHQPMQDAATGVTLAYNGEVFNFLELKAELTVVSSDANSGNNRKFFVASFF